MSIRLSKPIVSTIKILVERDPDTDVVLNIQYKVTNIEFIKTLGFFINNVQIFTFDTDSGGLKLGIHNSILDKFRTVLDFFGGFTVSVTDKTILSKTGRIAGVKCTDEFKNIHTFELRYV